jgi:membrane-bound lytic murein transglycosylase B
MEGIKRFIWVCSFWLCFSAAYAGDYSQRPELKEFIDEMVADHQFEEKALVELFANAKKKQSILDAISRPAERTKTWAEYRPMFVNKTRISRGLKFWEQHKETISRAEKTYGVPGQFIVAIIGIETMYGKQGGSYRVIDSLSTLAFDYPKRPLFKRELRSFLIMCRQYKLDPLKIKGSYAGAMGYGQFIPSSYLAYAVDFDGDNIKDIWSNPVDAIGSVANYLKQHGWITGGEIVSRARVQGKAYSALVNSSLKPGKTLAELNALGVVPVSDEDYSKDEPVALFKYMGRVGAEFWLGFNNFYTITRYNHSRLYAMSVVQLGVELGRKH